MSTITGLAGIDDCVGQGACKANQCSAACSTTENWMSYPNYVECGTVSCALNTTIPQASVNCNGFIDVDCPCTSASNASAQLWECGPCPNQYSANYYCGDGTIDREIIACVTSSLFTFLCANCNPLTWGLIEVDVTV
ncbi:MAG: hypothetical protein KGK34_01610 [Chloroflexota bacterium]|nr:hypothetical protein [Chloroflexota bacterium]